MTDARQLYRLLHSIYGAVGDAQSWRAVSPMLAQTLGGHSGGCGYQFLQDEAEPVRLTFTEDYTPRIFQDYKEYWHRHDILLRHGAALPGTVVLSQEVIGDAEFVRLGYYQDYLRRMDNFYVMGCTGPVSGGMSAIAIGRDRSRGPFTEEHRRTASEILPHVQQAVDLHTRFSALRLERNASFAALDALRLGVMIADASGKVLYSNGVADGLISTPAELSIRHGRLHLSDPQQRAALLTAIQAAAAAAVGSSMPGGGVFSIARRDRRPLSLRIYPLGESLLPGERFQPAALIFLSDPDAQPQTLRQTLQQLYRLTAAQAQVAEALLGGCSVSEYASRAGVSVATVRTQVQQIFAKTGHRRQADFVRDVIANPVVRMTAAVAGQG